MSQSRFSIVLVGVSALLRRPLVSRLRPVDGERSSWVVFTARVGRFESGFRSAGWPSGSRLPLFGTHRFGDCRSASWPSGSLLPLFGLRRFGVAAGRVRSSTFRFGDCCSSGWPSGSPLPLFGMRRFGVTLGGLVLPLGGLAFGLTASAFRHAPLRSGRWASWFFRLPLRKLPSAGWPSGSPLPLFGTHRFGVALGGLVLPLGELAFGLTASAFRHASIRSGCWASSFFRLPLRRLPSAGWPSGLLLRRLPFGGLAFGLTASEIPLGGLVFGLTASAFRHVPLRSGCWASWFFRLPFRSFRSASWPSGSLLPLFGMRRSAPLHRRSEDRRSTTTRQLFHFKTLIPTC